MSLATDHSELSGRNSDVTPSGIKGGQGRSGYDVESSAAAGGIFVLVGIALVLIALAFRFLAR